MQPGAQGTLGADALELSRGIAAAQQSQAQPKAFLNVKFKTNIRSSRPRTDPLWHLEGEATWGSEGRQTTGALRKNKAVAALGPAPWETHSPPPTRATPARWLRMSISAWCPGKARLGLVQVQPLSVAQFPQVQRTWKLEGTVRSTFHAWRGGGGGRGRAFHFCPDVSCLHPG